MSYVFAAYAVVLVSLCLYALALGRERRRLRDGADPANAAR